MSIADNVAEIIRLDRCIEAICGKHVVSLADLTEFRWLKQQRSYQVRAIKNYSPSTTSIR